MRPSRFREEQIIGMLKEQEARATTAVCCKHGISSATFHKFRAKYGGIDVSDAGRLKTLEDENARLKKLLASRLSPSLAAPSPHGRRTTTGTDPTRPSAT